MDNRPIGVFDSGVGGLTVTKEIFSNLPNEKIIYFGDSKRSPFGDLSKETLLIYSAQICDFLISQNVKALVVACNTMCGNCLDKIIENYDVPIIDVIIPSIDGAIKVAEKSVGLLATHATINSQVHQINLKLKKPSLNYFGIACPKLLPIIEGGNSSSKVAYDTAKEYLDVLMTNNIDTLILGCTHYPLMLKHIINIVGENIKIVDPSFDTAMSLKKVLTDKNILREDPQKPEHKFYISGNKNTFDIISEVVFGACYETEVIELNK